MRPKPLEVHDENGPLEKLLNVAEIAPGRISELCRGHKEPWLREIKKSRTPIHYF
jgi:hypothetical protein